MVFLFVASYNSGKRILSPRRAKRAETFRSWCDSTLHESAYVNQRGDWHALYDSSDSQMVIRDPKLGREVKTDGSRASVRVVGVAKRCTSGFQQFKVNVLCFEYA